MAHHENGRWKEELGCYSWWETLYYDDISHQEVIHNAFFLRLLEHSREHMLDEQYLANLIEKEQKMFVAVSTEQKHSYSLKVSEYTTVGNFINVRTKIAMEGKYRIRFLHEVFLFKKPSDNLADGVQVCIGHVDMVCVNPTTHSVVTLPEGIYPQVEIVQPKRQPPIRRNLKDESLPLDLSPATYTWSVGRFDTDFTKVVYQAKYLQYYEMSREQGISKILLQLGIDAEIKEPLELHVFKATLKFKEPAVYGDVLEVRLTDVKLDGKFKIIFKQQVERAGKVLNEAVVEVICINASTRRLSPLSSSS